MLKKQRRLIELLRILVDIAHMNLNSIEGSLNQCRLRNNKVNRCTFPMWQLLIFLIMVVNSIVI